MARRKAGSDKRRIRVDYTGRRFGGKLVLSYLRHTKHGDSIWLARCDCGNVLETCGQVLRKQTPFCRKCNPGFAGKRHRVGGKLKRPFESRYMSWTKDAKHPVEIAYEEYVELAKTNPECHYCGVIINWNLHIHSKGDKNTQSSNLDRKDCGKGYTLENVVVCCPRCNWAKSNRFTYQEWKQVGNLIRSWKQPESVPDATGDCGELVRQNAPSDRSTYLIENAQNGHSKHQSHLGVSQGSNGLVCSKGTSEDDATGHF